MDDDPVVVRALAHMLSGIRYIVVTCLSPHEVIQHITSGHVRAIVSDIMMPEMTGIDLLRTIRQHDPDLPVILVTGEPNVRTATEAVEYGAFKYLKKPLDARVFFDTVERAARLYRLAQAKRQALTFFGERALEGDRAGLEAKFERAMSNIWLAYQPIVRASDRSIFGYEALLRSDEQTMMGPGPILDAAERLGALPRLGRIIRTTAAHSITASERSHALFINLHPQDLLDPDLLSEGAALTSIAGRVVLEVTERSMLPEMELTRAQILQLRQRGFRIAIDDLGAGYAGLSSFALLEPEFVKLDMSLIRHVDTSTLKQKLVRSMTTLCREMGLYVVAEGIETSEERDAVIELGCDLLQGYLFARPAPSFPAIAWH